LISQSSEYALRATLWLAAHPESPHTIREVAEATKVPRAYLGKVLQILGRAGLVSSRRGIGGGFRLTRHPSKMTVFEVVDAVDPIQRLTECPIGVHGAELCQLHRRLDGVTGQMAEAFRDSTIEELATTPDGGGPLCE